MLIHIDTSDSRPIYLQIMDEVRRGRAAAEIAKTARSLRDTPEYCDKGYMCYFRDP